MMNTMIMMRPLESLWFLLLKTTAICRSICVVSFSENLNSNSTINLDSKDIADEQFILPEPEDIALPTVFKKLFLEIQTLVVLYYELTRC